MQGHLKTAEISMKAYLRRPWHCDNITGKERLSTKYIKTLSVNYFLCSESQIKGNNVYFVSFPHEHRTRICIERLPKPPRDHSLFKVNISKLTGAP